MKNLNVDLLLKSIVLTLSIATLSFFTLTSCSKNDMTGVAISQDGYSMFDNTAYYIENFRILKYVNANTGKTGVLCSKPNCKHELYDEKENPNPICNAVAKEESSISSCIIIDGMLYYSAERANNLLIYEYDYKNDKCEKVAEVENLHPNNGVVYFNGNIYFNCFSYVFDESNLDEGLGWRIDESVVCKYNIEDRNIESLFKDMDLYIQKIYPSNDQLYACCLEPFSGEGIKQRSTYVYDGKKCRKISDIGYYYFDDNNAYINPMMPNAASDTQISNKIMKYNFKTQVEEELCTGWVSYSYSHYLIYSDDSGNHYRYDSNNEETEEIEFNNDYAVIYIDSNYVIYDDFIDENSPKTYIVETEKFFNGNYEEARLIE